MIIVPQNISTPASITVVFYTPYFGVDLTTVRAVNAAVTRRDGTSTSFAFTIVSQTSRELTAQYYFSGGEITSTGIYYLEMSLGVIGGSYPGTTVAMYVDNASPPKLEDTAWVSATADIAGPPASPGYLTQAAWFIDPANASGFASDVNNGSSASTPLLTHGELAARWTAAALATKQFDGFIPLAQDTVVTYLSAPASPLADPIKLNVEIAGSVNLSYVYAPVTAHTSTFASLATSRGGANNWSLTATDTFTTADLASAGRMLIDTTRNTCAFVASLSGATANTSEWVAYQTSPVMQNGGFGVAMTAPQAGDAYRAVSLCRVKLTGINVRHTAAAGTGFLRYPVSFLNFTFAADPSGGLAQNDAVVLQSNMTGIGLDAYGVTFTQCTFEGAVNQLNASVAMINCYCAQGQNATGGRLVQVAGCENGITAVGALVFVDGFCLIAGRVGDQSAATSSLITIASACVFGVRDAFTAEARTQIRLQKVYYAGQVVVCGTMQRYMFRIVNGSCLLNCDSNTWASMFTATYGTFMANESIPCNMLAASTTTPSVGGTPYEVTVVNLDNPSALNGVAVNPADGSSVRFFSSH